MYGRSSRRWAVPIVDDNGDCNDVVFANVVPVYDFGWGIIGTIIRPSLRAFYADLTIQPVGCTLIPLLPLFNWPVCQVEPAPVRSST